MYNPDLAALIESLNEVDQVYIVVDYDDMDAVCHMFECEEAADGFRAGVLTASGGDGNESAALHSFTLRKGFGDR